METSDAEAHTEEPEPPERGERSLVDLMSEDSFPASDPPSVWTWEPSTGDTPGDGAG